MIQSPLRFTVIALSLVTLAALGGLIHQTAVEGENMYGAHLLPPYTAQQTFPLMTYSMERVGPLEVAKVFGRSRGCQDAGPEIITLIARTSIDAGLDPKLAASVIEQESGCDPLAVSSRGAVGLMQVVPKVWRTKYDFSTINLFNAEQNARVGTQILAGLVAQYGEAGALMRYQGLGAGGSANYATDVLQRQTPSTVEAKK